MWTWLKTMAKAPVPTDGLDRYTRKPIFGNFQNQSNVFGPYRRPIVDATGRGGQLIMRQLKPFSPNTVVPQQYIPVAITGNGSELTGALTSIGLVNVSNNNSSGVV